MPVVNTSKASAGDHARPAVAGADDKRHVAFLRPGQPVRGSPAPLEVLQPYPHPTRSVQSGANYAVHAPAPKNTPMFKSFLALLITTMPLFSNATEEPDYHVVQQLDGAEVRQYQPYVVAQVLVAGPADDAGSQAFPILAGYIFGKNKGDKRFAMTAPVTQTAQPTKLEMTAPVMQEPAAGGFMVQFVLPKGVTLATAPEPLDARVQLRQVPGNRVAVIRYSGLWSQSNYDEHLASLQAALKAAQIAWTGLPTLSRYDPPFTPWFMRRNEIWLTVQPPAQPGSEPTTTPSKP